MRQVIHVASSVKTVVMSYMIVTDDALETTIIKGPWDSTAPENQPRVSKLFKKFHSTSDLKEEKCKESTAKRVKTNRKHARETTTKTKANTDTAASNTRVKRFTTLSTDFDPQSDVQSCHVQSTTPELVAAEALIPPPPILETGTSLDESSADINAAINALVNQLSKQADHVTITRHIQELRRAEKNQAQIVQAMAQQMNETRAQIADAENKKRISSPDNVKSEPKMKPPGFDRSFIVRTINAIIKEHPETSAKLTVVKDILQEHESNIRQEQIDLEAETHEKMFVLLTEQKKYEATIRNKDDLIMHCYGSMDKWEKEVGAAHTFTSLSSKFNPLTNFLQCEANEQEIASLKERLHQTEHELKQAIHDRNVSHHDQSKAIIRLEREKTALVEANNLLEQTLATEHLKVINAENVKKIAMKYSGEVKESYDFYRAFYEKQTTLYDQYFAPRDTGLSSEE